MLNKKDIQILQGMFREQEDRFDFKLNDLRVDMRDELHSVTKAMESSLLRKMDTMKEEIIDGVIGVINDGMLPQIAELQQDMIVVKRHLHLI